MKNNNVFSQISIVFVTFVLVFISALFYLFYHPVYVSAAENETYTYTYTCYGTYLAGSELIRGQGDFVYNVPYLMYGVSFDNSFTLYFFINDVLVPYHTLSATSGLYGTVTYHYFSLEPDKNSLDMTKTYNCPTSFALLSSIDTFSTSIPLFSSLEDIEDYIATGDNSEQINKPTYAVSDDMPIDCDLQNMMNYDPNYKLTGFTSDYFIHASWTGATAPNWDRKFITKEVVYMDLCYSFKNQPTQIAYHKYVPFGFDLVNGKGTLDVSNYGPDSDEYILRCVNFIPCYFLEKTTFIMGSSVDMSHWYYGSINRVYLSVSGDLSGDQIQTDTGNANGNDLDMFNPTGESLPDADSALNQVGEIFTSITSSATRVMDFAKTVFSWLPWWVGPLLGCAIGICLILRIAGR